MQNLGKIVIFLIFGINIFAGITTNVSTNSITKGGSVSFTIKIKSAHNVKMPNITHLCQTTVGATSTQTVENYVNGKSWRTQSFLYMFTPKKSCVIKPMRFELDGKTIITKRIKIHVHPPRANSDSTFSISYSLSNKHIYLHEPFLLTLRTKLRDNPSVVDSNFAPSALTSEFKILKQTQIQPYKDGRYTDAGVVYLLVARRTGDLSITSAEVSLGYQNTQNLMLNGFLQPQLTWKKYFSNTLHVKILPVPKNVALLGSMNIKLSINKTTVKANRAVNAIVTVDGQGNFSDIGSLKPQIPGIAIFANSPKVSYTLKKHLYHALFVQKMTFVADSNFTIPAFTLKYFNPKLGHIVIIRTKAIKIKVIGAVSKVSSQLKVVVPVKKIVLKKQTAISYILFLMALVVGLIVGVLLMLIAPWRFLNRIKKQPSVSLKDTRKILTKLIRYKEDEEVQEMIDILEKKLYVSDGTKIDMQKLKKLKKRYDF